MRLPLPPALNQGSIYETSAISSTAILKAPRKNEAAT
jgi:hypothetical protein